MVESCTDVALCLGHMVWKMLKNGAQISIKISK